MADKHSSLTASLPRRNKATKWEGMEHEELPPPRVGFSYFTTPSGHANVTFVASSGDSGAGASYVEHVADGLARVDAVEMTSTSRAAVLAVIPLIFSRFEPGDLAAAEWDSRRSQRRAAR